MGASRYYITRNKVSSHLLTFMLRRTRSTQTCVFAGLASGGINPPEYIYNTSIVPDGGLGGGVYRGRGSAQDSCRNDASDSSDARISKCDELSSCRSIGPVGSSHNDAFNLMGYTMGTRINPKP